MKKILLIASLALLIASCRAPKTAEVPVRTRTIIHDRLVEIPSYQDSSSLKALFACDSNNNVILLSYNQLYSQYMSAVSAIEPVKDGVEFTIKTHTNRPAAFALVSDSSTYQDKLVFMPGVPYPVEKKLNWVQKTLIYSGAAAWLILLIYIVLKIYNPIKLLKP